MKKRPIVAVSGGFDPLHSGHINYILDASRYGDVIVILNSDAWLKRKKGYAFMPWDQRASIVGAIKGVIDVVPVDDSDGTVCDALRKIRPDYFAKGGDRGKDNTPEAELCGYLGVEMLYEIGGDKTESSSELVRKVRGVQSS